MNVYLPPISPMIPGIVCLYVDTDGTRPDLSYSLSRCARMERARLSGITVMWEGGKRMGRGGVKS